MSALASLRTRVWLRACDQVGLRPSLDGKPWIRNFGRIELGDDLQLASRPVQSHLDVAQGGVLAIGSGVRIGHGAAIAVQERVHIGDEARLGAFVVIADTDFHVAGDRDARPERAPVEIGRGAILGHRVTVLRGTRIGDGAQVVAGSVVSGVVPAGARVAGVPARRIDGAIASPAHQGLEDRVRLVVQRALGLAAPPPLEAGPGQVAEWTSLGTLQLLLALEEEFGVSLREEQVTRARAVADLVAVIESLGGSARAAQGGP